MSILSFLERAANNGEAPLDVEADAIIRAFFKRHPDAAYHVTKLAMSLEAQRDAPLPAPAPKRRGWLFGVFNRGQGLAS